MMPLYGQGRSRAMVVRSISLIATLVLDEALEVGLGEFLGCVRPLAVVRGAPGIMCPAVFISLPSSVGGLARRPAPTFPPVLVASAGEDRDRVRRSSRSLAAESSLAERGGAPVLDRVRQVERNPHEPARVCAGIAAMLNGEICVEHALGVGRARLNTVR